MNATATTPAAAAGTAPAAGTVVVPAAGTAPATAPRDGTLAITGWGVVTSLAIGADEFTTAVAEGRDGLRDVTGMFEEELPEDRAFAMPGFRVRDHLGRKGTSFFDRSTALALLGCTLALDDTDLTVTDANRDRVGIVLGTTAGSVKATSDYSRETLVNDRPYLVNPVLFPNTVMNCAAGQSAIWHKLKGVNATVAGGQLAGVSALRYARNQIRRGYADALLVGSVEEFSPHTAWFAHRQHSAWQERARIGEGSAVVMVEDAAAVRAAGRLPDAEVLAVEAGTYGPPGRTPDAGAGLAACVLRALERAGAEPSEVRAVATGACGIGPLDDIELRGVESALGTEVWQIRAKEWVGECQSAAGSLQIAALLAGHRSHPELDGELSVVTSVSADGSVGAAVLRGWHRARRDHRS
ncbi:beta-ketoacyl synthase N-terminal-like domain-containing protein [Streptomyces sp. NPDC093085]|uniref:beta-ketoacyl synthase N-terminal-like domain-containing protein n=1 Tax=Streptomyces sp. NPDC093085 TaxID=3155068 RepID=UPI0034430848